MKPGDLGMYDPAYVGARAQRAYAPFKWWFRVRTRGWENLPDRPFLGVGNHSGGVLMPDVCSWVGEYHARRRKTPMLTLAHDGIFSAYPQRLACALAKLGAIRAERGQALEALRTGHAVTVYPGGDDDACRPFWKRNRIVFSGRTGYVKLAQEAKVPIVPVVSVGAHAALIILWTGKPLVNWLGLRKRLRVTAWPLALCLPWIVWLGPHVLGYVPFPTRITLSILPPVDPAGSVAAVDAEVRRVMQHHIDSRHQWRDA